MFWGDYLYYNLTIKAYTLEFLYNNSCCIADIDQDVNNKFKIMKKFIAKFKVTGFSEEVEGVKHRPLEQYNRDSYKLED